MAIVKTKKTKVISEGASLCTFLRDNISGAKGSWRINDFLAEIVAKQKLPFTSKSYYSFCDKYLSEDAEEALFLDGNETYFREIATDYDTLKYLAFLKSFFRSATLCDIGCGIGNVLHFATKMSYLTFGYELNLDIAPVHAKIKADVLYGDILQIPLDRLATADIIYLYRPINDGKLMNRLFKKIHTITRPEVIILYNYPHSNRISGFEIIRLGIYDADMVILLKQ